jgi:hypothetical protein
MTQGFSYPLFGLRSIIFRNRLPESAHKHSFAKCEYKGTPIELWFLRHKPFVESNESLQNMILNLITYFIETF